MELKSWTIKKIDEKERLLTIEFEFDTAKETHVFSFANSIPVYKPVINGVGQVIGQELDHMKKTFDVSDKKELASQIELWAVDRIAQTVKQTQANTLSIAADVNALVNKKQTPAVKGDIG